MLFHALKQPEREIGGKFCIREGFKRMRIDRLKEYGAMLDEREDLRRRIARDERKLIELEGSIVSDSVKGTRSDGTYGSIRVSGLPDRDIEIVRERLRARKKKYTELLEKLDEGIDEVEEFISGLDSSMVRMILRMRYVDRETWAAIGRRFGMTEAGARMKVERYFAKVG